MHVPPVEAGGTVVAGKIWKAVATGAGTWKTVEIGVEE
jgi:hypothetical protein